MQTIRLAAFSALALTLAACMTAPAPPSGPWLEFATLQPGKSPNSALACAADICPLATLSRPEFSFAASAERVAAALHRLEPSAQTKTEPSGDIRVRYVAVTPLMRFRDDVDVLIRPVSQQRARMGVYSRSRIGVSDLGANAARIRALETRLAAVLGSE
jgi:uncharacterized protein (DUF1499 family)